MTNGDIINIVRDYVLEILSGKLPNDLGFHTGMGGNKLYFTKEPLLLHSLWKKYSSEI